MAVGDVYFYHTNVADVVAFAESDEYTWEKRGEDVTVVDLVLTGFSSGTARRKRVTVGDGVNEASATAVNGGNRGYVDAGTP